MSIKVTVNSSVKFELVKKLQNNYKAEFKKIKWEDRLKVTYTLMDLHDASRNFLTNDLEALKVHLTSMDKSISTHKSLNKLWEAFVKLREKSYEGDRVVIDFIDMIYLPVHFDLKLTLYPTYLMLDEVQDFNLCQHKLIDKLLSEPTLKKWVGAGDRAQAIYGFSGASSSSFELFKKKDNVMELPLDINYRSKSNILDKANEVFDIIKPFHTKEGVVETIFDVAPIKPNSMIICRNVSPLVEVYFQMLALGKPCYIKSADILAGVTRYMKPYAKETVISAKYEMIAKMDKLKNSGKEEDRIRSYRDKENFNTFKILTKHLATDTTKIKDLLLKLKSLYVNKKDASMLCSIHKSKGLEADVVYILNESLIPSKFAVSPEQKKQEQNLKYVARTRAREEMYFLNL